MATTPKAQACQAYCKAMAAGKGVAASKAAAQNVTKIGHAVLDLAWYASPLNTTGSATPELKVPVAQHGTAALALRAGKGWQGQYVGQALSWGRITVALGYYNPALPASAETQVRNQFGATSGIASQGTRINRGGRRLNNEPRFYTGNHKAVGVEAAKPRQLNPEEVAAGAATYKAKLPGLAARKVVAAKPAKAEEVQQ